ncbi:zinc finger matrin-type protein CG9776 isoform X2 [Zophobas morio]|uniref:zinc finger matrin-type protein CG9776 isoform X2 n=1 Tax=Zophobas morio TaxID=2755281 RepID=UPI00308302A8
MADGYCRVRSSDKGCISRPPQYTFNVTVPTKIIINKRFFGDHCSWLENSHTMYNNPNQYSSQGYQSSYPQYQQNYNSGYGYEGYSQNQYLSTSVQPVPPGEEYPQNNWAPVGGYHANSVPAQTSSSFEGKNEDEAVAQERKAQNAQLIKQREEYVRKARVLRRELELLRNQKHEIMSENSSQRDMELILKENVKLQDEIQSKMKAIHNVIEMLSSIIKDGCKISDLEAQLDESPKTHHKNHVKSDAGDPSVKYNYMHYDPELHWCRMCDEFPKTAKDFLLHLQSDKHRNNIQENDVGDNTPWHKLPPEQELPCYEGAPKKRIPIRGLQFFISAPAWYCKLCDTWIGDLHCASHHLKSQAHFQNYANFVEQNPHWEIEWLKDREKAMARSERHGHSSDSDDVSDKKKRRHKSKRSSIESSSKDKKKKKRSKKRRKHSSDTSSSSSSSDSSSEEEEPSDKSKSIRVVMRNMKVQSIMNEDLSGKWEMLERLVDEHKKKEEMQKTKEIQQKAKEPEDTLINQWMTVSEPQEKEKVLLDNLKDRMKQKQELERAKYAEMEKRQREKEREEREMNERKAREEQEAKERFERERKERDREEYERIRDKERSQVRFKTKDRENYRKRRTPTPSPERPAQSPMRDERRYNQNSRDRKNSKENGRESQEYKRSRSRSKERRDSTSSPDRKKPPGPPSKRLPFIGRMPLFKNKKIEEKVEKEIKKEDYDIPRVTRFQPGNLARAFLPQPDVVCFPKLSSFPPLTVPPPPTVSQPDPPEPPKISEEKTPKAPPAPKIGKSEDADKIKKDERKEEEDLESMYNDPMMDPNNVLNQYYPPGMDYNMIYSQMYEYSQCEEQPPQPPPPDDIPLSHTMPLQPPPLPPNDPSDDLAMLGISADDMAAQSF